MKRFIAKALAAAIVLTAFSACTPREQSAIKTTSEPEVSAVSEVTKAPEPTIVPSGKPTTEPASTPESKFEKLDIPVYPDDKLLLNNFIVQIGEDACQFSRFAEFPNKLDYVYELYAGRGKEYCCV